MSTVHPHSPRHRAPSASAAQLANRHPWMEQVGRAGWLAKGVVYIVAGVLALTVAARALGWADEAAATGEQEASPTGALKEIAQMSAGPLLLWVLGIGMFLYALWRLLSAALPGGSGAESAAKRVGYLVSAAIYASLGFTAIRLAGSGSTTTADGNQDVSSASSGLMDSSLGRFLIGLAGAVVVVVGLYHVWQGLRRDVDDDLDLSGMDGTRRRWLERLWAVGEVGRGIGISLIGGFLFHAALTYDPDDATGIDGALRRMATEPWGKLIVVLVGAGFIAHGLFCALTFPRRRLQAP